MEELTYHIVNTMITWSDRGLGIPITAVFSQVFISMSAVKSCSNPTCGNTESKPGICLLGAVNSIR